MRVREKWVYVMSFRDDGERRVTLRSLCLAACVRGDGMRGWLMDGDEMRSEGYVCSFRGTTRTLTSKNQKTRILNVGI